MTSVATVSLRIHSGVPVLDVVGDLGSAIETLNRMISALTAAGHFDIVVNVQRPGHSAGAILDLLANAAQDVRAHCGHIDIVGPTEQMGSALRATNERSFRFAASEETAIGRIKRTPVLTAGSWCTARPSA